MSRRNVRTLPPGRRPGGGAGAAGGLWGGKRHEVGGQVWRRIAF